MSNVIQVTIDAINCLASPDPAKVTNSGTQLRFVLDGASINDGYTFSPSDAIRVKVLGSNQFIGSWTLFNGTAVLVDLNNILGTYEYQYDVSLIKTFSDTNESQVVLLSERAASLPEPITFDPTIVNNW